MGKKGSGSAAPVPRRISRFVAVRDRWDEDDDGGMSHMSHMNDGGGLSDIKKQSGRKS